VTEQTRIDRLMAEVTDAALTAAALKPGEKTSAAVLARPP
jgi:hypothetical protein